MTETTETEAAQRAGLYALLAGVFRRPLDGVQLARLRDPVLLEALVDAGIDPGEDFTKETDTALLDRLAIDYTQLFHTAADRVIPYEGVQTGLSDQLMGAAAQSVRAFMAQAGYAVHPQSGELPDHIWVELAFMGELTHREAQALCAGDKETADLALALQRRFLEQHLGRWASSFAQQVQAAAATPFYRDMAVLLDGFIASERGRSIGT